MLKNVFPMSCDHYGDVTMRAIASQITDASSVCSNICAGADQIKHQSAASLTFMAGTGGFPHKGPEKRKMFSFDGVIMTIWIPHIVSALSYLDLAWWRHQMETFPALLAICAGNSPASGEFPTQRPVTRSFDVFFDLRLNKRLSKQSWGWWFETLSRPSWRQCNGFHIYCQMLVWFVRCYRNPRNLLFIFSWRKPKFHIVLN